MPSQIPLSCLLAPPLIAAAAWGAAPLPAAPSTAEALPAQQQPGSIRGVVSDQEFAAPLAAATVQVLELDLTITANDQGMFLFPQVPPGTYTLVFSKDGYVRQLRSNVIVAAGQLTDVDVALTGDFTDMEEFIVQDLQIGGGEAGLLALRMESPALIDSISAELMSRAGASDAAGALRLVAGASVQDGKYAVIRGLPDRYVNSQLNGIRLPTADEDKRAVQLDQFPAAVIDSIQVSKTFTPDQQGDASGGAVNVMLKGIPDENIFRFSLQTTYNTQSTGRRDFLSYDGGGVNTWGKDDGDRDQQLDKLGENWTGAVGVTRDKAPTEYKWSLAAGGKHEFDNGVKIGGFASFFYERDSSFFDNGVNDSYWVTTPGGPMVPETTQGNPSDGDFKTKLFDVTQATDAVQWGGLGAVGVESKNHQLSLNYLYTHIAEDQVTLAEDTRGKAYFFPGYDPRDPTGIGNSPDELAAAPYIRTETLQYTERTTQTLQLKGKHTLPLDDLRLGDWLTFTAPEIDWYVAQSSARLYQPDKRQFGSLWLPPSFNPGFPPFVPPFTTPALHLPFKPAANFTLGNLQRIWKEIDEDSTQFALNLKLPFEQWSDSKGYLKFGLFDDSVDRKFNQDTFSNFNDNTAQYLGEYNDFWSQYFPPPTENHPISDGPPFVDVDYKGEQNISAWYAMIDLPLTSFFNLIGGARFESTSISIVNDPEIDATWFPPGTNTPTILNPGDADVDFSQDDVLPSIGFVFTPIQKVTLRGSYAETVARQTFKELSPIPQQEFLGADVFIGNPNLQMSDLENFDLRLDYTPYAGGLFSISWFKKDVTRPIEYVQRVALFTYTTPVNYPNGTLDGFELEARQDMGQVWERLTGLSLGANATFINSSVNLPADEIAQFAALDLSINSRDMTGAPEFLYNLYLTYDLEQTGTQFALFYTVQGDTLVAGAGVSDNAFVPDVYAKEYGTLNFSISQKLGKHITLQFQAKNLTDPTIKEVYRSDFIDGDVTKTSYTKGIDYSIGLSAQFTF